MNQQQKDKFISDLQVRIAELEPQMKPGAGHGVYFEWAFAKMFIDFLGAGYELEDLEWFKYNSYEDYCKAQLPQKAAA